MNPSQGALIAPSVHSNHTQQTATLVDWKTLTSCSLEVVRLGQWQTIDMPHLFHPASHCRNFTVANCESHMPEGKLWPRLAPSVQNDRYIRIQLHTVDPNADSSQRLNQIQGNVNERIFYKSYSVTSCFSASNTP